ncbi:hypothetical protein MMC25_001510 [Agyrium rufum]|nr:hypothetical protein [Agyrium rufum]
MPRDEDSVDSDQENATQKKIKELADQMKKSSLKRRDIKRKAADVEFRKGTAELKSKVETGMEKFRVSKSSQIRHERLHTLLRERAAIEKQMIIHMTTMERAYLDACRDFRKALTFRMDDLAKMHASDRPITRDREGQEDIG